METFVTIEMAVRQGFKVMGFSYFLHGAPDLSFSHVYRKVTKLECFHRVCLFTRVCHMGYPLVLPNQSVARRGNNKVPEISLFEILMGSFFGIELDIEEILLGGVSSRIKLISSALDEAEGKIFLFIVPFIGLLTFR